MSELGRRSSGVRLFRSVLAGVAAALMLVLVTPGVGEATVSISRAEVKSGKLRIEGRAAPNQTITVDGVAMGSSDGSGRFRVERSGYVAPADCTGTVTLTSAASTGGLTVALSSDNTTAATVPPSVTVAAGATSATFPVTTNQVTNSQSAIIIGTAGSETRHSVLTVVTQFENDNGSISLARGGNGEGRVTSQPAGIDCTFTPTGTIGTCGNAFFPTSTQVRLEARAAAGSSFLGWDFETSCRDAPNVTVAAGVAHICRPVFRLG